MRVLALKPSTLQNNMLMLQKCQNLCAITALIERHNFLKIQFMKPLIQLLTQNGFYKQFKIEISY